MPDAADDRAVLASLHAQIVQDLGRGGARPVEHYVGAQPGHATLIRAEYPAVLARARAASGGDTAAATDADSPSMRLVNALAEQRTAHRHYENKGEIARGGMGAVVEVWDEHLRRALAMKVILRGDPRAGAMFIEEAQVTGRLDHPGIVPVHELGMDAEGRLYFTMRLVKGETLKDVFEHVQRGDAQWSQARVLHVLLKVCDAMAYAHSKGVVHRDIKPANVMVGRFGEVYVMDWGLARVLGTRDRHDLRLRPAPPGLSSIHTLRDEDREAAPDSPLVTMDGEVVGTPAYMPPEQAEGRVDELDPRSDVYSVGALLYHLLTGRIPYTPPGGRATNRTVLAMLLLGPPQPVQIVNPQARPELVAICEKAMARDPARRYADMREMADDLRAYVEGRVVHAYEAGALAEFRKWVRRNPWLAASMAAVVLLSVTVAFVEAQGRRESDRQRGIAQEHARRVSVLSDRALAAELEREAQGLWPIHPRTVPALESWLARARELAARTDEYDARLLALRARALPYAEEDARLDRENDPARQKLETLVSQRELRLPLLEQHADDPGKRRRAQEGIELFDALIAENQPLVGRRRTWRFADPRDAADHDSLERTLEVLRVFASPETGASLIATVEERLERSRTLAERTVDARRAEWERALARIADRRASPAYGGLVLRPQVGLVPLGPDPDTGLEEFAVPESGDVPERGADGRLVLSDTFAIVLVLLPGGEVALGAQRADPSAPRHDADADPNEAPVRTLPLAAWFCSKHEMTQAQWRRLCGERPSTFDSYILWPGPLLSVRHPVEQITWDEAVLVLARVDLVLPTEAQWEHAARAGTSTPWCTGATADSLAGAANVPDHSALRHGQEFAEGSPWAGLDDGFPFTAPVGSYAPNAFGLHDICGNVSEWCRDLDGSYDAAFDEHTGLRAAKGSRLRVLRGGSFRDFPIWHRSSKRDFLLRDRSDHKVGVRPARLIDA